MPRARALCALVALFAGACCKEQAYKEGDNVPLYVNTVGPYFNPSETYPYYTLPVCKPGKLETVTSLGGKLDGDKLAKSLYDIKFKENAEKRQLCTTKLSVDEVVALREAIEKLYYFEFELDGLTVANYVGLLYEKIDSIPHTHEILLGTHHHFSIEYNGDKIITANVTVSDYTTRLPDDAETPRAMEVTYTYSVAWSKTSAPYSDREKAEVGSLQVHWLSIINSFVLVILMTGFVALILMRVLRSDFSRYSRDEEDLDGLQDDYGWKLINGDVFRVPQFRDLLCAILGTGAQFLVIMLALIVMALAGTFNTHQHGYANTAGVVLYAFTSGIAGYVSASMYRQLGGERWVRNILMTTMLFVGPMFIVWSVVNSIAWYYHSTQALSVGVVMQLFFLWLLVGLPLTIVGGVVGKNMAKQFQAPCRTKVIPREIPVYPWYQSQGMHMLAGGFLPFTAISVELYYVFLTLWGRHLYTLYGILSAVFVILLVVTACVSIMFTYFQLSMEDYRWWWRSMLNVGTTGLYIFAYSVFYWVYRSNMSGSLQTANYFGYTFLLCYIVFMMLGTVGFFSSLKFVKYIYSNVKTD